MPARCICYFYIMLHVVHQSHMATLIILRLHLIMKLEKRPRGSRYDFVTPGPGRGQRGHAPGGQKRRRLSATKSELQFAVLNNADRTYNLTTVSSHHEPYEYDDFCEPAGVNLVSA